jgi:hypothetical protein
MKLTRDIATNQKLRCFKNLSKPYKLFFSAQSIKEFSTNKLKAEAAAPGPLLPFVVTIDCCGAARQTGHSLRVLNRWMVELTHGGTKPTYGVVHLGVHLLGFAIKVRVA